MDRLGLLPYVLLATALALGGYLRFSALDTGDLYGDAAEYALIAQNLRDHPFDLSYSLDGDGRTIFVSQPHLVLYAMAGMDVLFGPSDVTARYTIAAFGMLGILAAYLLGREAHSPLAGAGAALFVAVMPVHVDLSRSAMLEVPFATTLTVACWLALRALRTGRTRDAVFAGLGAALATLAKLPGILVVVALVLFLAVQVARERLHFGSWEAALAAPTVAARVAGRAGALRLAWAAGAFLAVMAAYLGFLAAVGAWDAWTSKMAWQFGRVSGSGVVDPWTVYFVGPHSLPSRMGPGLWAVGVAGVCGALAAWAWPRRAEAPRAGDALLLTAVAVVVGFFLVSDRKIWFYVMPVAPLLVVAGSRCIVAGGLWLGRLRLPIPDAEVARYGGTGLALALVALVLVQAVAPAYALSLGEARPSHPGSYGANYDEACDWVRANRTGDEGVFAGLLSRYAVRYYCPEVPVLSRFREQAEIMSVVAQREVRWLVTDPYYSDDADKAFVKMALDTFPHATVAEFGGVEIVEFRPTNLTADLLVPGAPFERGDPVPVTLRLANPAEAPARDLSGAAANWTVWGHDKNGWAFRIWHNVTVLGQEGNMTPGAMRNVPWTWPGGSYWSKDTSAGRFYVEVVVGGELVRSAVFRRG